MSTGTGFYKNGNGSSANTWKWVATFLSGILLATLPWFLIEYDNPNRQDYEKIIEDVQVAEIERTILREQLNFAIEANQNRIANLEEKINELLQRFPK